MRLQNKEISIEEAYLKLAPYAISKCMRIVGRFELAEEIVQDTFLKLHRSEVDFDEIEQVYKWVYRVAHNAALDFLKSSNCKVEECRDDFDVLAHKQESSGDLENQDILRQKFSVLVNKLDQKDLSIFGYYYFDGMIQQEIADLLSAS